MAWKRRTSASVRPAPKRCACVSCSIRTAWHGDRERRREVEARTLSTSVDSWRRWSRRDATMVDATEVWANTLLFMSALLLLVDIAPRDVLPSHRKRVKAFAKLREQRNIM